MQASTGRWLGSDGLPQTDGEAVNRTRESVDVTVLEKLDDVQGLV